MPSEIGRPRLALQLDEHYPGWPADELVTDGVDAVSLTARRPDPRGADDTGVLRAAVAERRIVVTEGVSTFGAAALEALESSARSADQPVRRRVAHLASVARAR